jgi:hypothetical protein
MPQIPRDFFLRSLALEQAHLSPQHQVVLLAALESVGFHRWSKTEPIFNGGELCLEEMAQVLTGKDQELVEG